MRILSGPLAKTQHSYGLALAIYLARQGLALVQKSGVAIVVPYVFRLEQQPFLALVLYGAGAADQGPRFIRSNDVCGTELVGESGAFVFQTVIREADGLATGIDEGHHLGVGIAGEQFQAAASGLDRYR